MSVINLIVFTLSFSATILHMTAVPKHWPSSRRQGRRRASDSGPKLIKPIVCKNCGQPKMAGFQCSNCKQ